MSPGSGIRSDELPAALLAVLRDLRRADVRGVVKSAIGELVARRALVLEAGDGSRRGRGSRRGLTIALGPASAGNEELMRLVAGMVAAALQGRAAIPEPRQELSAVARRLARQPQLRRRVLHAAFADLEQAGLLIGEERRALGLFRRSVLVRTAAGEAVLRSARGVRRVRAAADGGGGTSSDAGQAGAHRDEQWDRDFDSSFDSGFDSGGGGGDGGGGGGE